MIDLPTVKAKWPITSSSQMLLSLLSTVVIISLSCVRSNEAQAQQIFTDGTTETATGDIDMGTISGTMGIALRARNGGVINTIPPLTITTGGSNAIAVQATFASEITLSSGTSIYTRGSGADGVVSSGNSQVHILDTDIRTDNIGYGIIAGTSGRIDVINSTVNARIGTGIAAFSGGEITLNDSIVTTGSGLALWVQDMNSTLTGTGLTITSDADRGAVVLQGTLALTNSSIESNSVGIQTGSAATVSLTDTTVSTTGASAYGVYMSGDSVLTMHGGSIRTVGTNARALYGASGDNHASINNAVITAEQSSAILAYGSTANLEINVNQSSITGNTRVVEVGNNATLTLNASGSELTGVASTATGSTSTLSLHDNTVWKLTGNSVVTNLLNDQSLIDFTFTGTDYTSLKANNYAGNGGRIGLNTQLEADASLSDQLIIDGGRASGTSKLVIANTNGSGALTTGNGILVIDTINGGTSDDGAFQLAGPVVAGPYEYSLYRTSLDTTGEQNWYLRSELVPIPPDPDPDPTPDYRAEVSLYAAIPSMAALYGRQLIGTFHERTGETEQLIGRQDIGLNSTFNGAWIRGIGHWGHRDGAANGIYDGSPEYDYHFGAVQAGLDVYRKEDISHMDTAGLYFAYGNGRMDVTQNRIFETRDAGSNNINAVSLGGYWTRIGDKGWYLDSILQSTWYNVKTSSQRATEYGFPDQKIDGFGIAASIESGYPFILSNQWQLEPQVQLVWQHINFDAFHDGAADIRYDKLNSLSGRLGARIARTWDTTGATAKEEQRLTTMWGRVSLWREFIAKAQVDVSSAQGFVPFATDLDETWIELGAGATHQISQNTSLYGNVNYSTSFDGNNNAWNGKIGLRVNW